MRWVGVCGVRGCAAGVGVRWVGVCGGGGGVRWVGAGGLVMVCVCLLLGSCVYLCLRVCVPLLVLVPSVPLHAHLCVGTCV